MLFLSAFPAAITSMLAGDAAGDAVQFPQRRELELATSDRVSIRLQSAVIRANDSTRGGGGGHSLIWPILGRAAGQGMVFGLLCPEQGIQFYANLS